MRCLEAISTIASAVVVHSGRTSGCLSTWAIEVFARTSILEQRQIEQSRSAWRFSLMDTYHSGVGGIDSAVWEALDCRVDD